jgi:pimeloyl-CoA synthetase
MGEEGIVVPGGEGSHSRGFRVALMRKEDRQISVDNLAQDYTERVTHAESETSKHENVKNIKTKTLNAISVRVAIVD